MTHSLAFLHHMNNAWTFMSEVHLSAFLLGFFASLLLLAAGMEIRLAGFKRPAERFKPFEFTAQVSRAVAICVINAYLAVTLPYSHPVVCSIPGYLLVMVLSLVPILLTDAILKALRDRLLVFKAVFALLAFSVLPALHLAYRLVGTADTVVAIHWVPLLASALAFSLLNLFFAEPLRLLLCGKRPPVLKRIRMILGFAVVNSLSVIMVSVFVQFQPEVMINRSPLVWFDEESFLTVLNALTGLMVTLLMAYVYVAHDRAVLVLEANNEALEQQNESALNKIEETQARLNKARDKARQLELEIEMAQKDHQVSVEGLVAALASLEDGMFEWDLEQDTLNLSKNWRRTLGLETQPKNVPVNVWRQCILGEDQIQLNKAMQVCLTQPASSHITQFRYRTPYGALLKVELRIVAVRNAYGLPSKLVGVLHDRTHEMDLELSIREELNEESLLSSRKSQFVDYLSHEIRTPMTVIGSAKALIESSLMNGQHETQRLMTYVDQIGFALKELRALVDETLMFMGSGFHRKNLNITAVNVEDTLSEFFRAHNHIRGSHGRLEFNFHANLTDGDFFSDEYALNQAMRQLVTYCQHRETHVGRVHVKRTPSEGLRIDVELLNWPAWLGSNTLQERRQANTPDGLIAFKDEHLPFSLLLTKRVIRIIGGRLMIIREEDATWLCVDLPSLKEDACPA